MKKLLGILFGAVLLVGLMGGALAGAQVKIGLVDLVLVIDESDAGKEANAQLTQLVAVRQADLDGLEIQITDLEREITQSSGSMAAADLSAKQTQLDQLVTAYIDWMNAYESEIQELANRLRQYILSEIVYVLQYYGDANGFDIILDSNAVLYFRSGVDLTLDVIRTYNELREQGAIPPAVQMQEQVQ